MAKENFQRTKPHVNIGTNSSTVVDTFNSLTVADSSVLGNDSGLDDIGGSGLAMDAPASSVVQTATVAFPIDDVFVFDPKSSGPARSIDFQLDIQALNVVGTDDVEVSLALIQDEAFLYRRPGVPLKFDDATSSWTTFGDSGLTADAFVAVDGDGDRPDFSRPFQFGYSFTSEYSTTALDIDLALDNMLVEITTIPEPTSVGLVAAMGAVVLWDRWFGNER